MKTIQRIASPLQPETVHNQFVDVAKSGQERAAKSRDTNKALADPPVLDWVAPTPADRIKNGALKGGQSVRTAKKLSEPVVLGWVKK